MKKILILVRHGESADKQPGQQDFDRILTERGVFSIEQLGVHLFEEKIIPKYFFSSAAIRTKQTIRKIAKVLNFDLDKIVFDVNLYEGSESVYLDIIHQHTESILIVGHNPTISTVIGKLTGNYSKALSPGQGAFIEIDDGSSKLVKLLGPFIK